MNLFKMVIFFSGQGFCSEGEKVCQWGQVASNEGFRLWGHMHESEFLIICDMQRSSESTEPLESRSVDLCKWNFEMVLEVSESNRNCFRNFYFVLLLTHQKWLQLEYKLQKRSLAIQLYCLSQFLKGAYFQEVVP